MDGDSIIMILIMIALTACSAFFSATETAYLSFNQAKMKTLAASGDKRAQMVLSLYNDYDRLITSVLVGNNIVNISLSSISTVLFIKFLGDMGATVSTVIITVIVLIFGEITPKTVSKDFAESFALSTVYAVKAVILLFYPLSFIFGLWQKLVDRISNPPGESTVTEDEIITLVDEAEEGGGIDSDEGELIRSAIGFSDVTAGEILTPRSDVIALNREMTPDEIAEIFMESGFSRLPMCGDSLDDVLGILHEKDFLYSVIHKSDVPAESLLTKPVFVSKHIKIYDLLKLLQDGKCHMAVVSDEFGSLCGIVTVEDIVEELLGEIWDEHDKVEELFILLPDGSYQVDCSAELDALFELFGIENEEGDEGERAQTVNGWIIINCGRIPEIGETLLIDGLSVEIIKTDGTKIIEAKISKIPDEE